MKIAIVDDIREEVQKCCSLLADYAEKHRLEIRAETFDSGEAFLSVFRPHDYDLIFMDIYMDGISGIEAAEKIRITDSDEVLVFLTTSPDHMAEAFHVHAFDYLIKPVEQDRLFRLMDDVLYRLTKNKNQPKLTFISQRDEISLLYTDIISVTSMGNYLEISALNDNVFKTRMTFSTISEQLMQDQSFLVINRGILVNMNYVTNISERSCIMTNGIHFPVNAREFRKLRQAWLNYSIAQIRNNALEREIR